MIINHHILKLSNVCYSNKCFFIDQKDNLHYNKFIHNFKEKELLDKNCLINTKLVRNLIVVKTLHSCYSHAIERAFGTFWAIDDIKKHDNEFEIDYTIMIREKEVMQYWKQNSGIIDNEKKEYKKAWKNLLNIVAEKYLFEHLLKEDDTILIKNCYFFIDDNFQRTFWNNNKIYPNRNVRNVLFDDTTIDNMLYKFINKVKNKYIDRDSKETSANDIKKRAIIIERKRDRKWSLDKLEKIKNNLEENENVIFNGIIILEELTFEEQVKLYSQNNVFIFIHGSSLINLLWSPKGSLIFDVDPRRDRQNIVKRLGSALGSTVNSLDYNNIDYSLFSSI